MISDLGAKDTKIVLLREKELISANKKNLNTLNKSIDDWEFIVANRICYILSYIGDDESASIMHDKLNKALDYIVKIKTDEEKQYIRQLMLSLSKLEYTSAIETIGEYSKYEIFRNTALKALTNLQNEKVIEYFNDIENLQDEDLIYRICETVYYLNNKEWFIQNVYSDNKHLIINCIMFLKKLEVDNWKEIEENLKNKHTDKEILNALRYF